MATEQEFFEDHLVVRHPDGEAKKVPMPQTGELIRLGRELDNDIVLTDPSASRYHAELRWTGDSLQVKDLNSSNGVMVGPNRIKPDVWEKILPGQLVRLAETRLVWEQARSSQSTVAMKPQDSTVPSAVVPPTPPPPKTAAAATTTERRPTANMLPWAIGGVIVLLLLLICGGFLLFRGWGAETPPAVTGGTEIATPDQRLSMQTPGALPTDTPTPTGPQMAIPQLRVISTDVEPIFLGALPSTDKALLLVQVRVENVGNAPFVLSTGDFSLRTAEGRVIPEAGSGTTEEGLRRLGAVDRFDNLNLTPGGSVPESLLFELQPETYNLELVFDPAEANEIVLGLGMVEAGLQLAMDLGTPLATPTPMAIAGANTPTPTPTLEPTPTATRPPIIPAPQVVPRSALVGTIAYPVYNGSDYDIYLGRVDGSGTSFYREHASQPTFSPDGERIAFHSWAGNNRGIVTMDISGANPYLVSNFIEDQLPTWTADGQDIILLSRRTGGRQSQLIRVSSSAELEEGAVVGEGEYPTVGSTGELVFKGWGTTAYGLRISTATMEDIQTVTNVDEDTAPALSPDGERVVFMSRRQEQWDIYLINRDGSDLQRLTNDPADDGLPVWSPDGNAIAFVSNRGGPWAVWAMTPDGAGKRQLFTMEGSPDGFVGDDRYASRGWAEERISWTAENLGE